MTPFIKFLHQFREISKLDEFPRMTHLSKLIFDQVALYEEMGNPLTVREMLSFNEIASPATIHKRGCTEFCVNGLMAGNRRISSSAMNGCLSAAFGFCRH